MKQIAPSISYYSNIRVVVGPVDPYRRVGGHFLLAVQISLRVVDIIPLRVVFVQFKCTMGDSRAVKGVD